VSSDIEHDPRRMFTRAEVRRVWERQGRVCVLCERAIPFDLMHGDHVHPWSAGGRTILENCQALCGSCNLRKGSQPQEVAQHYFLADRLGPGTGSLRPWQLEALDVVLPRVLDTPVLVEACPGAGKTHFGLEVAYRLLSAGEISRLIVVTPTIGICDGWLESASAASKGSPTIPLRGPRSWSPVNPIGDRFAGVAITYQGLFFAPDMILAHATDPGHRTMVIFDEVHHAGARSGWGERAQAAFAESAAAILSLSGTPFRTDRDPIVFVPSTGSEAAPDYRYGYDRAIADGACRPVQFVYGKGSTTFRTEDGALHTVTYDDALTTVGQRKRLRTTLKVMTDSSIAALLIEDANEYLLHLRREGDADAAGLVVCADCDHADSVATFLTNVIGRRPVVAYSRLLDPSDAEPANAIRDFKRGHAPWLVSVNMVSEGVDIRRLRVVVHLTNRLTLLSFRQIVGRVVRTDSRNVDDHGRVYIPADPTLVAMAETITDEVAVLPPPMTIVAGPQAPRRVRIHETGERPEHAEFEALSSVGERGGASDTHRRRADEELLEMARAYVRKRGLTSDPVSLALAAAENPALRQAMQEELRNGQ
jgi:superfamily II DNA or RNA helicase